jgi:prepilin-type N-terminal cleavage/methylation domain-containing protein
MKKLKGFTLIEVLVTSLLVGFLGLGSMVMVANSTRILNGGFKQALSNGNIQSIMRDISFDIKGGVLLSTTSNSDLVIVYSDKTQIQWYFEKGKLFRKDKAGKIKEILLHGADNIVIEGKFLPEITGKYYKSRVELKMLLDDGNTFEVANITNTYFCRLQFAGYI